MDQGEWADFITIYGGHLASGRLTEANIAALHRRLRQRIRRAGLTGIVFFGGTEVVWRADTREWLLHVHLIAIGAPAEGLAKLKEACRDDSREGQPAFKCRTVDDRARLATYLQKFEFYHRPGKRTGRGRPGAVPLPPDRACEFAEFLLAHRFEDFMFLAGGRRQGTEIVPVTRSGT